MVFMPIVCISTWFRVWWVILFNYSSTMCHFNIEMTIRRNIQSHLEHATETLNCDWNKYHWQLIGTCRCKIHSILISEVLISGVQSFAPGCGVVICATRCALRAACCTAVPIWLRAVRHGAPCTAVLHRDAAMRRYGVLHRLTHPISLLRLSIPRFHDQNTPGNSHGHENSTP